jgi:hypothetical protein
VKNDDANDTGDAQLSSRECTGAAHHVGKWHCCVLVANSYCKFEFPTVTPGKYTTLIGYTLNGFGIDIIESLKLG